MEVDLENWTCFAGFVNICQAGSTLSVSPCRLRRIPSITSGFCRAGRRSSVLPRSDGPDPADFCVLLWRGTMGWWWGLAVRHISITEYEVGALLGFQQMLVMVQLVSLAPFRELVATARVSLFHCHPAFAVVCEVGVIRILETIRGRCSDPVASFIAYNLSSEVDWVWVERSQSWYRYQFSRGDTTKVLNGDQRR